MAAERVLIIDDSIELRSLLESILPYSGYQALSASTGEEGIELATKLHPDVILVDLELPDTTGLKVIEELGRRGITIPAIMITGYGSEGTAARALRLGAQGYLVKPFTTEEVLSSVEKALVVGRLNREKAKLESRLDAYTHHFRTLAAMGSTLIKGGDLSQVYQRVVDAGAFVTRAEKCILALLDPASGELEVTATRGKSEPASMTASPKAGAKGLRSVLERGACVRLQAASGDTIALQTGDRVRAVLQVPLKRGEQIVGLLSVDRLDSPSPFDDHDELMLAILANCIVIALEMQRLTEKDSTSRIQNREEAPSQTPASQARSA